ncbi:hypothetical protein ACEZCY_14805 [Streptacidiphilus sp. N1-12]|uniref:Uncharacterized protein n=2 Tax=Streptacidiphilus alkalitolerans TaxID=3342712 RepID=A0ABV6WEM9_9ACTN
MPVEQLSPVEWLSQADPTPEHAYNWWVQHPDEIAMIPAGVLFDAVKVRLALGDRMRAALGASSGPVFSDADNGTTYFLVPPGTAAVWPADKEAACLGAEAWLWVPVPSRIQRTHSYWDTPPDGSGALHDPQALLDALATIRGAS